MPFLNISGYLIMKNYLNFEKDIKSLENEIEKLQDPFAKDGITQVETGKLAKLQNDLSSKLNEIYSNLDPWQTTMVARHEDDERKIGTEIQAAKQNAEELSAALQAELSDMNAQQRREQVRFPL